MLLVKELPLLLTITGLIRYHKGNDGATRTRGMNTLQLTRDVGNAACDLHRLCDSYPSESDAIVSAKADAASAKFDTRTSPSKRRVTERYSRHEPLRSAHSTLCCTANALTCSPAWTSSTRHVYLVCNITRDTSKKNCQDLLDSKGIGHRRPTCCAHIAHRGRSDGKGYTPHVACARNRQCNVNHRCLCRCRLQMQKG